MRRSPWRVFIEKRWVQRVGDTGRHSRGRGGDHLVFNCPLVWVGLSARARQIGCQIFVDVDHQRTGHLGHSEHVVVRDDAAFAIGRGAHAKGCVAPDIRGDSAGRVLEQLGARDGRGQKKERVAVLAAVEFPVATVGRCLANILVLVNFSKPGGCRLFNRRRSASAVGRIVGEFEQSELVAANFALKLEITEGGRIHALVDTQRRAVGRREFRDANAISRQLARGIRVVTKEYRASARDRHRRRGTTGYRPHQCHQR